MRNIQLFQFINSWAGRNYWLDQIMIFSAEWLGYVLLGLLFVYLFKNRERYTGMVVTSLASAIIARFVFVEIIRYFYNNPRPFLVLQNVNQLVEHETTSSFPSGHATFYFALATGVYLHKKKAGYAYFALAGLMGFARVFVGVHWPLDIVAGAGLGIAVALLLSVLLKRIKKFSDFGTGSSS